MTDKSNLPRCELCGEPMPEGESMFKFHGFSGPCPAPPLPRPAAINWQTSHERALARIAELEAALHLMRCERDEARACIDVSADRITELRTALEAVERDAAQLRWAAQDIIAAAITKEGER